MSLPLLTRFPALGALPRAELGTYPSPVERVTGLDGGAELWIKRDDLNAPVCGGNKVRALELLLGRVREGDTVVTVGGEGSTHVLCTAVHAARLGARTVAVRWPHAMNPVAHAVAGLAARECAELRLAWSAVDGVVRGWLLSRTRGRHTRAHWVPLGGSVPLGVIGHVNAALELAEQIAAGELPPPEHLIVPFGSGGTAAGLALGLAIAGLDTTLVAARVGPRIAVNRARLLRLADQTAALIERLAGLRRGALARPGRVAVAHHVYGGAYGRPLAAGEEAAAILHRRAGLQLDATYGAKALAAALDLARRQPAEGGRPTLFWMTFDARVLSTSTPPIATCPGT